MAGLSAEAENALATAPTEQLLEAVEMHIDQISPASAYCIAKRVNMLRVERAAPAWSSVARRFTRTRL